MKKKNVRLTTNLFSFDYFRTADVLEQAYVAYMQHVEKKNDVEYARYRAMKARREALFPQAEDE